MYGKTEQLSNKGKTHKVCSKCSSKRLIKFFQKPTSRICNDCKRVSKRLRDKPKTDRRRLIRQLDDEIRNYIKTLPDTCCCCGKENLGSFHPKENPYGIQVGHFISREVPSLRWDKRNCNPQCSGCNKIHQTNQLPYLKFMLKTYGQEVLEEFTRIEEEYQHTISKIPNNELEEMLEELKK